MASEIEMLAQFLYQTSGLVLETSKGYLVESRLTPLLRNLGILNVSALLEVLKSGKDPSLKQQVIDAMMTNETFFFRDRVPFDNFRDVILPKLVQARQERRRIRIWCAASSTGQEPYSLAMILDEEARRLTGWNVEILATDLSSAAIKTAREGRYTQFEVQRGLPISHLLRYFQNEGGSWKVNEYLRAKIQFNEFNLLSDFRAFGSFDIIFCRNVLIYMDIQTREDILRRISQVLAPDGYLIMGSAETVVGLSDFFAPDPNLRMANIRRTEPATPTAPFNPLSRPLKPQTSMNADFFGL